MYTQNTICNLLHMQYFMFQMTVLTTYLTLKSVII